VNKKLITIPLLIALSLSLIACEPKSGSTGPSHTAAALPNVPTFNPNIKSNLAISVVVKNIYGHSLSGIRFNITATIHTSDDRAAAVGDDKGNVSMGSIDSQFSTPDLVPVLPMTPGGFKITASVTTFASAGDVLIVTYVRDHKPLNYKKQQVPLDADGSHNVLRIYLGETTFNVV